MHRTAVILFLALVSGCDADRDMKVQPVVRRQRPNPLYPDRAAAQPPPAGTVPRSFPDDLAAPSSEAVTRAMLLRGQDRFNVFCAVCHGRDGDGSGPVVRRGFPAPPSLHDDAVRALSDQHYVDVITHGLGKMPPYAAQVPPPDRAAIVAYIRALQFSQHADAGALPPEDLQRLPREEAP